MAPGSGRKTIGTQEPVTERPGGDARDKRAWDARGQAW